MRRVLSLLLGWVCLLALLCSGAVAQGIIATIDLDDSDPDLVPDSPYGEVITPDGRFLLVCISGDPDFDPNPPQLNNNQVRVIDRSQNAVVHTITTGLFPVECAVTVHGEDAYLFVANSSDGTVSVFRAAQGDFDVPASVIEEPASPIDVGLFSFPNAVVSTPDQRAVYVATAGGSGEILKIDADPASPTFLQGIETIVTAGVVNRMVVAGEDLVVTQSVFDPTYTTSTARVTMIRLADPADRKEIYLTPPLELALGELASAVDVAVRPDGKAYVTVFGTGTGSNLFVLDVPNRTLAETRNLGVSGSENLHGIALSPDGRLAAVTIFDSARIVLLDLATDGILGIVPTPDQPNEAVWSKDGYTLYVTNQAGRSVSVVAGFPGRDLVLAGTTTPSIGGTIELVAAGGEEGRRGGVLVSEAGNDGGMFKGVAVPLSNPVHVLEAGFFDVAGTLRPASIPVPSDPTLVGRPVYYLAVTKDAGGTVRLSKVLTVIHQP